MSKTTMFWILAACLIIVLFGANTKNDTFRAPTASAARDLCQERLKQWQDDRGSFEGARLLRQACENN